MRLAPPVRTLAVLALVLAAATPAASQVLIPNPDNVRAQGAAFRYYTLPGALNIQVVFVGPDGSGIYTIAEETTLTDLLALAGAAGSGVQTRDVQRDITVRLLRAQGQGERTLVYEAPLERVLLETETQPQLVSGDIVEVRVDVRPSRRQAFLDSLQVVSTAGTLVIILLQLLNR